MVEVTHGKFPVVRMSQPWNRLAAEAAEAPLLKYLNQVREISAQNVLGRTDPTLGERDGCHDFGEILPSLMGCDSVVTLLFKWGHQMAELGLLLKVKL